MLIAGAGGFAKEILEVVITQFPPDELFFFDDRSEEIPDKFFGRYKILKNFKDVEKLFSKNPSFALGVGSPDAREYFYNKFKSLGGKAENIFSDHALIGKHENKFSDGIVVMPQVIIEASNTIGAGVLIHAGTFISHDVSIGNFCEISPYVKLLGNVTIGDSCSIGTAAVILPGINIGTEVTIGAGAVVTKDVMDGFRVAGIPAKPIS
jgi:sugar O-acyltransferase (sialic acid O-acetyltransferase NeuD family)